MGSGQAEPFLRALGKAFQRHNREGDSASLKVEDAALVREAASGHTCSLGSGTQGGSAIP